MAQRQTGASAGAKAPAWAWMILRPSPAVVRAGCWEAAGQLGESSWEYNGKLLRKASEAPGKLAGKYRAATDTTVATSYGRHLDEAPNLYRPSSCAVRSSLRSVVVRHHLGTY